MNLRKIILVICLLTFSWQVGLAIKRELWYREARRVIERTDKTIKEVDEFIIMRDAIRASMQVERAAEDTQIIHPSGEIEHRKRYAERTY